MENAPCACGQPGEWPDGYDEFGVERFLCQDCWEHEIDQAFWSSPLVCFWQEPSSLIKEAAKEGNRLGKNA